MFEFNFRDDRYLPFEGAGVHSTWTLRLPPPNSRPFDYDTLSDVVMHLRYTARDGAAAIPSEPITRMQLLISLRHDFPLTWRALQRGDAAVPPLKLSKALFPFSVRDATVTTEAVRVWFGPVTDVAALAAALTDAQATLSHEPVDWNLFSSGSAAWADLKDCFIVVDYSRSAA